MRRLLFILAFCSPLLAQNWSGILAPSRAIDWSFAGTSITDRSTICVTSACNTMTSAGTSATIAQINAAIVSACDSNTVVKLPAGTINLSDYVYFNNCSNITFRGAGANQTFLIFSAATTIGGIYAINSDTNYSGAPHNIANWTANYSKGTQFITLSNTANLQVGSLLILDQQDDASDPGNIWVCQTQNTCISGSGNTGVGRSGRGQMQQVKVISINGNTVGFVPGLYAPNWRSSQNPGAWWSNGLPATGIGIEDMSLDVSASSSSFNGIIYFQNIAFSWVKNVRLVNRVGTGAAKKHVQLYQSSHITVKDSYFYGSAGASESYGVDSSFGSSDNLIQNNICQHVATCWIREGDAGSVFGHNYAVDNFYTVNGSAPQWQQGDGYSHAVADNYGLWEGNIGSELELDDINGTHLMHTAFRNYWSGCDPNGIGLSGCGGGAKTQQTLAAQIYAGNRYMNLVANVLGKVGYHTAYQCVATTIGTSCPTDGNHAVMAVGFSSDFGTHGAFNNDLITVSSLMRWGNYDTVNATVRYDNTEDGHSAPTYPGLSNLSTNFPKSFYLTGKPSWWGAMPWPAIGPDVLSGPGPGGHAYQNPAQACYLLMGGLPNGTSGALPFNPLSCYLVPGSGIQITGNPTFTGNFTMTVANNANPVMTIVPASLAFGSVGVGGVSTLPLTITNTGTSQLVFSAISLADSSNYSQTNNCTTVAPSGTCIVNVTFSPHSVGTLNTTITLNANDAFSPHVVNITGIGIAVGGDLPLPNFSPIAFLLPQLWVDPMIYSTQTVQQTVYVGNTTCPLAPARTNYKGVALGATVCDFADSNGAGLQSVVNDWCGIGAIPFADQRWDTLVTHGSSFNFGSNSWVWCDKYNGTPTAKFIVFHSDTGNPRGRTVCSHGIQDVLTPPLPDPGQRNHGCAGLLGFPAVTASMPVTSAAYTSDSTYNDLANMWTITSTNTGVGSVIQMGPASTVGSVFSDCGASGTAVCPTDGVNHIGYQDLQVFPAATVTSAITPVSILAAEWINNGAGVVLSPHAVVAAPHDIFVTESYLHGDTDDDGFGNNALTNMIQFACANCAFNHNYMDGIKRDGAEDHGINLSDAPGPLQVDHNYMEGASIVFWGGGGSPPATLGLLTTNVERRRNWLTYNQRWLPNPGGLQSFSKPVTGGSCSGGNTLVLNVANTGASVISPLVVYLKGITGVGSITNQWYTASSITATAVNLTLTCTNGTVTGGKVFGFASNVVVTSAAAMNAKAVKDPTFNNPVAKNRSENKEAQSTVEDGEILENSGADGQAGYLLLVSVRACGGVSWCSGGQNYMISDWITSNTIMRHGNQGIQISARSGTSNYASYPVTNTTCDGTGNNAAITATGMNNLLTSPLTNQTVYGTDVYVTGSTVLANGFYATAYPTGGNYNNDAVVTAKGTAICTPAASDAVGQVYGPQSNNGAGVSLPGRRYVFQNNLIYDVANHANWNGTGSSTMLQNSGGTNNFSVTMTVTQVSPVVIVNAAVTAISACPVSQLCPKVIQASVGDYAYVQCLADPRFSSGPALTKGASILSVAANQLSFTFTPQNGSPALSLSDTTTCPIATWDSPTDSGYYNAQSFPWPFYWNHNTAVGVNQFVISPANGGFNKNTTYQNSFQLLPGTTEIAPANLTSAGRGFRCNNSDNYSPTDLTGITYCNDRLSLTLQRYVISRGSIGNYPNFLNGVICGTVPCSQDPAVNPNTNSVPLRVSSPGAAVTCGGVPCDATHFLPDSVGFAGSMNTSNYPLNLPDFRNYALDTSSPYRAGANLQGTDNKDIGVQMSILLNAQNRTLYPCSLPCGTGPHRDGPQYAFLTWSASGDPMLIEYRVYQDGGGTAIAHVAPTYFTVYGLAPGSHTWQVKAWNGSVETPVTGLSSTVY